jgi:protein-tyrosine-phosphatase
MNAVRSPLAERLARTMLGDAVFVASAGVRAGERDPFVDATMRETGLGPDDHTPKTLDELEDDYFDLIVTLSPEAHHAALELTRTLAVEVEYWPMPDPAAARGTRDQIMDAYRDLRDRLQARLAARFGAGKAATNGD